MPYELILCVKIEIMCALISHQDYAHMLCRHIENTLTLREKCCVDAEPFEKVNFIVEKNYFETQFPVSKSNLISDSVHQP